MRRSATGLAEAKAQRWRALAIYQDGQEGLLYLGTSYTQVQEGYDDPYFELLDDEERDRLKSVHLQKWVGAPDSGHWVYQRDLPIPESLAMPVAAKPRSV
jgi:hypothetical protein